MSANKGKKSEEDSDDDEAKRSKKRLGLFALIAIISVGGVYKFVLAKPAETAQPPTAEELAASMSPEEKAAILEPPEGEIIQMDPMILNMSDPPDTFLKIRLALVLDTDTLAEEFQLELPIAQDVAVLYLSSLGSQELRTSEGKQRVKAELSEKIKAAYKGENVMRVLITELVMQ